MLVEASQLSEAPLAEIAAVPRSIPSSAGRQSSSGTVTVPADLLVRENMIGVDLTTVLVNLLPIDTRWASARLEM